MKTAFVFLALAMATIASAANIVLDGGFESIANGPYLPGALGDGWVVTGGEMIIQSTSAQAVAHSGAKFLYLDDLYALNTIQQTLPTVPGQTYNISLWVADDSANFLSISFDNQTLFSGTGPSAGVTSPSDYVLYSFNAQAHDANAVLSISGQWLNPPGDPNGAVLDDVSVTTAGGGSATPEPATFGLGLSALIAMAFAARRSGKI